MIAGLRDFRPSIFGKANTCAQIGAIFFALLFQIATVRGVWIPMIVFLRATFLFTIVSAIHYALLVQHRLRQQGHTPALKS
jgi:cardiolipin synthase